MASKTQSELSHQDLKKNVAQRYYVFDGLTQVEIAEMLGVTQGTVSNWIKKYGWDKERDLMGNVQNQALLIQNNMMRRIVEIGKQPDYDLDEMNKAVMTLHRFQERNTTNKLEIFADLVRYIQTHLDNPEQRNLILKGIQDFIEHETK